MIEAIIINGLVLGAMYAILAVGFSLVFGVARILNLAHTAFYMVAGYLIFYLTHTLGVNLWLASIFAIASTCILTLISYRLFFDKLKEHELAVAIVSIALGIVIQEALFMKFGAEGCSIPYFISGNFVILGTTVLYENLLVIFITAIMLAALSILLIKTKLGHAIRAISQDKEIANLMGINVSSICAITICISVMLAGIGAAVLSSLYSLVPTGWASLLVGVLAAVVLGGLGSIKGSIMGAFALGYSEALVVFLVPGGSYLRGVVSLTIMITVLLIKPEGLFGKVFEEERL